MKNQLSCLTRRRRMMNKLQKKFPINTETLDKQNHFQSILQALYNNQIITDFELENIQLQVLEILNKQVEIFTRGESSSVRTETAQSIMQSICYCISIYLKSIVDIDFVMMQLKQKPLKELYEQGRKIIDRQVKCAKVLLTAIKKNKIKTQNYAYNDTIDNGLPPFFAHYQPDFGAHEVSGSIDYPLCFDKMDTIGIEYVYSYLQKLLWENQFCSHFTSYRIHCVMHAYDKNYADLLINIFERVLINALGCVICNNNICELNISKPDIEHLQGKLKALSKEELENLLQETAKTLFESLQITNRLQQSYIMDSIRNLSDEIKNALNLNQVVFVNLKKETSSPDIRYEDGISMTNENLCKLIYQLEVCIAVEDKVKLIQQNVHSLVDLIDIFESECILQDEYIKIFESLDDMIIAVLYKRQIFRIDELYYDENDNKDWELFFLRFFASMDNEKQQSIISLAERIKIDLEDI